MTYKPGDHKCLVCGTDLQYATTTICNRVCQEQYDAVERIEIVNADSLFPTYNFRCPSCAKYVSTLGLRETAEQAAWAHMETCHPW